jgi:hypothetical protein
MHSGRNLASRSGFFKNASFETGARFCAGRRDTKGRKERSLMPFSDFPAIKAIAKIREWNQGHSL